MNQPKSVNRVLAGIALAVTAAIIWSGNFVIARAVHKQIGPFSLAFYRWFTASCILFPFAIRKLKNDWQTVLEYKKYIFWVSVCGITLFNTFIYLAGHYTNAINLALIGTTSSPVFAFVLAAVFLKERISSLRVTGLIICIIGILVLLSSGSLSKLLSMQFTKGDFFILVAALCFAIYNTLVKKKPAAISPLSFLLIIFIAGTIILIPFFIWEYLHSADIKWNINLVYIILYLGAGTSVISYLCWNAAIARIGAVRTVIFGNLIPVFSSLEAVLFLKEQITVIHILSLTLVIGGLFTANIEGLLKKQL